MEWTNSSYIIRKKVQQTFSLLKYIFIFPVVILYLLIIYFQIFRGQYYYNLAEKNRSRTFIKFSPRGIIYDSNGIVLADNRAWMRVYYYPFIDQRITPIQKIIEILPESKKLLFQAMKTQKVISLSKNISREKLFELLSLRHKINGIEVDVEYRRRYIYDEIFAHVIGYVSELNQKEYLKLKDQGYYFNDLVGKSGIEKTYENYLRGEHGALVMEVDAHGIPTKVLRELRPISGNNIHLTIDSKLQILAHKLLVNTQKNGAVVGVDPRNGAIKIMVSCKDFNPNTFITEIDERRKYLNDKNLPLFNRCIQGVYPPGSTYKILATIAALSEDRVSKNWSVTCTGQFKFGDKIFKCWEKKGHGSMDMLNAIKNSCNVYFCNLALKLGIENFEKYSALFGFGNKTNIDIPSEVSGVSPSREWKEKNFNSPWFDGDTINIGIGQGYISVTPLQLAMFTATIANKGILYEPFIVSKITDQNKNIIYKKEPVKKNILKIKSEIFEFVEHSMIEVVRSGTGRAAFLGNEILLAGKTGTAQNPHGNDHALFICYGPIKENTIPTLALAIVIEHGLRGGAVAAPIAREIFKQYLSPEEKDDKDIFIENYKSLEETYVGD